MGSPRGVRCVAALSLEACERELTHCEQASQEQVRAGIRVGVVLQGLEECTLKQYLLPNSEISVQK